MPTQQNRRPATNAFPRSTGLMAAVVLAATVFIAGPASAAPSPQPGLRSAAVGLLPTLGAKPPVRRRPVVDQRNWIRYAGAPLNDTVTATAVAEAQRHWVRYAGVPVGEGMDMQPPSVAQAQWVSYPPRAARPLADDEVEQQQEDRRDWIHYQAKKANDSVQPVARPRLPDVSQQLARLGR